MCCSAAPSHCVKPTIYSSSSSDRAHRLGRWPSASHLVSSSALAQPVHWRTTCRWMVIGAAATHSLTLSRSHSDPLQSTHSASHSARYHTWLVIVAHRDRLISIQRAAGGCTSRSAPDGIRRDQRSAPARSNERIDRDCSTHGLTHSTDQRHTINCKHWRMARLPSVLLRHWQKRSRRCEIIEGTSLR